MFLFRSSGRRISVATSLIASILPAFILASTLPVLAEEDSRLSLPLAPSAAALPPAPRYTLATSVEQALRTNPQILANGYRVLAATRESRIAFGQMLPSATLSYGRTFTNNISGSGAVDPDYIDQDSHTASVQLTQPLFAGGMLLEGYEKSLLNEEVAAIQKESIENQIVLDVQLAFLDLVRSRGQVRSLHSAEQRLETGVEAVKAFERVRLAPYVDVLQTEVELANTRQQLSKAEIAVSTQRIRLNSLLGLPVDATTEYIEESDGVDLEIPWSLEQCLQMAMEKRPDLRGKRKVLAMAEKDAEIVFGRYWPRVDLQGSYYKIDRDYETSGVIDRDYRTDYWTAGINVQWRLIEGGRTYNEHRRTLDQISALKEELRDMTSEVAAQVHTYYLAIEEARQRIATAGKALGEANEAVQRAQVRFESRVASIVELLDAQARLSLAEFNQIQAQADLQKAQAQLLYTMGQRNPALRF